MKAMGRMGDMGGEGGGGRGGSVGGVDGSVWALTGIISNSVHNFHAFALRARIIPLDQTACESYV